jgi:hypothetical protein
MSRGLMLCPAISKNWISHQCIPASFAFGRADSSLRSASSSHTESCQAFRLASSRARPLEFLSRSAATSCFSMSNVYQSAGSCCSCTEIWEESMFIRLHDSPLWPPEPAGPQPWCRGPSQIGSSSPPALLDQPQ